MSDYVIIVPKTDELIATEWGFQTQLGQRDHRTRLGVDLYRRRLPEGSITFALLDKQTNTYSSLLTAEVIATEAPRLAFLLGTAMGRPRHAPIGSVLASDGVIDLSERRVTDEGPGNYVQRTPKKSDELTLDVKEFILRNFDEEQIGRHFRSMTQKPALLRGASRVKKFVEDHGPKVLCETIISGNDYRMAEHPSHADDLWKVAPTARAYDMEAAGFAMAAASHDVPWLVLRGISDYGTRETKSDFHRKVATGIAARFLSEFLKEGLGRSKNLAPDSEAKITIAHLRDEAYRLDGVWVGAMAYLDDNLRPVVFEEYAELTLDGTNVRGTVRSQHYSGQPKHNELEYSVSFSIARHGYAGGVWSETIAVRKYFGVMLGQLEDDSTTLSGTWLGTYQGGVRRGFFRWHNTHRDGKDIDRPIDTKALADTLIRSFTNKRTQAYNNACGVMS